MHRICTGLVVLCAGLHAQSAPAGFTSVSERWDDYVERTYGWRMVSAVALEGALEQTIEFRKCGRPPYCFPHHIGGGLARRTARTTIEFGAGALFGEDLRRVPSGLTGFRRRAAFALLHAPLARGRDGKWGIAYSRFVGTMGAVAVTKSWEGRPITPGTMTRSVGWTVTSYFQDALWAEFEPDVRRFGSRTWRGRIRPMLRITGRP